MNEAAQPSARLSASVAKVDRALIDDLVAATRTLARFGVLDAFGHVSVRDPKDPKRYLISRSIAPESVLPCGSNKVMSPVPLGMPAIGQALRTA